MLAIVPKLCRVPITTLATSGIYVASLGGQGASTLRALQGFSKEPGE